jgi:RHS repeat-associated protein
MGFGFDKMNRLVAETNAVGQVTRMVYDAAGNLRQKINANGQTNFMAYNALNQLTNRVSGAENVAFGYDPNGNLTNMVDSLGTTRQTFDRMNRLVQVVDPFGQTVSNQYNLAGQRTKIVYPDGKSQTFAYDGASRLTNVQASAFGLSTTAYAYDSRNNLTGANLPGGLAAIYSHDAVNRRLAWSVSKGGSNLLARACERDSLGFRANETIAAGLDALAGAATQTRTHDAADQITGLTQSGPDATRVPSFDAAGNMTQLVASARGQIFTTRYSYDYLNRLTAVTRLRNAPDGSTVTTAVTQLEYDGQGLLLRITENGNVRHLVRDRADSLARPLVEMDAMTNTIRRFVWANGKLLAQVAGNGTIRVAHSDELGRILALTDANGVLTDEYAYQPYGRLIAHSGTNDLPFAFMGDYGVWSAGNGLYLTRHRAYDSNLMRFLQPDPIGLEGGYNLYAYAAGNPTHWIDSLGLEPCVSISAPPAVIQAYMGFSFIDYRNSPQYLRDVTLTIGAQPSPVMAQINALPFALVGSAALGGTTAITLAPALHQAGAGATLYYIQYAPQINQGVADLLSGMYGPPSAPSSPIQAVGMFIGAWQAWNEDTR